jgi:hypothetical protein
MKKTVLENSIHLPDLSFVDFCESNYGINRGVYNTIDAWFYGQGVIDILDRRRYVLSFLEFIKPKSDLGGNFRQKFGPGGLTIKLHDYCSSHYLKTGT